ncbi:MAG: ATPase [Acidobacteria bacterium]|nr:MAG: ATPase [Acidobacteriota bacterium]
MTYKRVLNIPELLKRKSFFLFGPRSTGKTTLVHQQLSNVMIYDLLRAKTYSRLLKNPELIEQEYIEGKTVVIDEIQKLPAILDEVHRLIEKRGITFLLTGSSARKIKHGGANLLAGRAWSASLFALTYQEIDDFNLDRYLNYGGLPQVYTSEYPEEELISYVGTYLQEEIKAEAVTRNIQAFAEFLEIVALSNGCELNYQSFADDCRVSPNTIKNYLQILEDTLLGFPLRAYKKTKKRKAISRSKFYLFDIGVTNYLARRSRIKSRSKEYGDVFEHFIMLEVRAYLSYLRKRSPMYYWRSTSGTEVDLILDDQLAIEIKSTEFVQSRHLKGLRALKEEGLISRYMVVSHDERKRITDDGIEIMPWELFLRNLWEDKLL